MTPPPEPIGGHYNPVFITVLPKERRSRQPYQLWMMMALVMVSLTQILLGIPNTATSKAIPIAQAYAVNILCLVAGLTGIYAAFIPERIIRVLGKGFDATWSRLIGELAGQVLLVFVMGGFVVTVFSVYPVWTREGLATGGITLGGGLALFLGIAAFHRSCQIARTLHSVVRHKNHAVVGIDTMLSPEAKGG